MLDANLSVRISTEISNRQRQAAEFDNEVFQKVLGNKWAVYQYLRNIISPSYVIYACWPDPAAIGGWDSCIICGVDRLRDWYKDPTRGRVGELTIRVPDEASGREIGQVFGRFREGGFSRPRGNTAGDDGRTLRILVPDLRATGPDGGHGWRTHPVYV